jgi:biotin operon repressor
LLCGRRKKPVRKPESFIVLAVLLFGLAACQKQSETGGTTANPQKPAPVAAQPSPWKMATTVEPAEPTSETDTTFQVRLTNEAGAPVSGAEVKADLKMSLMDMGKNVASLADKGNGIYEGKGRFSMTGPWDVIMTASKDGKSGTQTFPVVVRK